MNRNMRLMFERIRDGVVIVSPDGIVRYANPEAARIMPMLVGAALDQPQLLRQLQAARNGHIALPVQFRLDADHQQDGLDAYLLASPVGEDLILLLHDDGAKRLYETTVRNLMVLVQEGCESSAQACLDAFAALKDADSDADSVREQAHLAWQQFNQRITELTMLAAASANAPLEQNDRLPLAELLKDSLSLAQPDAKQRRITLTLAVDEASLPTVYGSRDWLSRAIGELAAYLVCHAPSGGEVLVRAHVHGEFLALQLRSNGRPIPAAQRDRLFLPFEGCQSERGQRALRGLGLGMTLARAVISRHGGHVRLDESDEPSLMIELPIGAPHQAETVDAAQMERYARDLSRLMARRQTAPALPQ
ncbi:sensor histidine kinase [Chitinimonas sp.]|uniref:sensor histidine kinase n=1 Tax=Chitinimonas sp. TaxID=1934313 RepID=UPI0035B41FF7